MIIDDIKYFEYDRNLEHKYGIKSAIIWGYSKTGDCLMPLLYITKPKCMSKEEYEELLNKLVINIIK